MSGIILTLNCGSFTLNQRTKMQGFPRGMLNFSVSYALVCDDPKRIFWN